MTNEQILREALLHLIETARLTSVEDDAERWVLREVIESAEKALAATASDSNSTDAPEEWLLVPIKPTKNMLDAVYADMKCEVYMYATVIYETMLATSPKAIAATKKEVP